MSNEARQLIIAAQQDEIDRLRAELAEAMSLARHNEYEAQTLAREVCEAEATIARVRELEPDVAADNKGWVRMDRVLRALDGGTE